MVGGEGGRDLREGGGGRRGGRDLREGGGEVREGGGEGFVVGGGCVGWYGWGLGDFGGRELGWWWYVRGDQRC